MATPEMNMKIDCFMGQYLREIKKWLGNAKNILVVGTKLTDDSIPLSICARSVLEADGKRIEYIDKKDWYSTVKIHADLLRKDVKTIVVENDRESISKLPVSLAKDIIKHYDRSDNFKYVNRYGAFNAEQTLSLYLSQILSKKPTM